MDDWNAGWWVAMVFMMVVLWGAVIALAIWGISRVAGPREREKGPLDIAKERLAKSEISEEEFERIRQKL